ncbi:MAG TPA: SEC-C metal-binding domain-containing protein, partial [Deltaproteobacteria bacterium]|nr:SEC-C metal-binding domain-containing protein [Deltaproteobacteria bacterium]
RSIEGAQKKVEARNFEIRKHLLEYDDVMNKQREVVYTERRRILAEDSLKDTVLDMVDDVVAGMVAEHVPDKGPFSDEDINGLKLSLKNTFGLDLAYQPPPKPDVDELQNAIIKEITALYDRREAEFTPEVMRMLERQILLMTLDSFWKDHLLSMDHLKDGIGLRGYGQKNPLREYQREGYDAFVAMLDRVKDVSLERLFKIQIQRESDVERINRRERKQRIQLSRGSDVPQQTTVKRQGRKVGRNEPCPCGSGKKYKQCCGRDE